MTKFIPHGDSVNEPTEEGVWVKARELRQTDVLDFRGVTERAAIDGVPISKLTKTRRGRIRVEVVLAGTPRYREFAPADAVCIRRRRRDAEPAR